MHSTVTNRKTLNIAFYSTPPSFPNRNKPGVIFLPGFKSDMMGGKAVFLEEKCKEAGMEDFISKPIDVQKLKDVLAA